MDLIVPKDGETRVDLLLSRADIAQLQALITTIKQLLGSEARRHDISSSDRRAIVKFITQLIPSTACEKYHDRQYGALSPADPEHPRFKIPLILRNDQVTAFEGMINDFVSASDCTDDTLRMPFDLLRIVLGSVKQAASYNERSASLLGFEGVGETIIVFRHPMCKGFIIFVL
jgi:hypothetical protein